MEYFDVIGVGFGPSNLSVAVVLEEKELLESQKICFFESKASFAWHPGMLLENTQMQISFIKDLATLRSPTSQFTFLNYLHQQGRMEQFANLREFYPSRHEFNDYLVWAANFFSQYVHYSHQVVSISPCKDETNTIELLRVKVKNTLTDEIRTVTTKNLILAIGGKPAFPEAVELINVKNAIHSAHFLPKLKEGFSDNHQKNRFLVVGSGQSAAEIFTHLMDNYPNSQVTATMRGYAYKPADETEFVNEIFSTSMVDTFYSAVDDNGKRLLEKHKDTNYSVVDPELIRDIYKRLYEQKVTQKSQHQVRNFLELNTLVENDNGCQALFTHTMSKETVALGYDAVFLATGYERIEHHSLLNDLSDYLLMNTDAQFQVNRHYKVQTSSNFSAAVYLQGTNEHTHGLSDTLLSILAVRADEIVNSIFDTSINIKVSNEGQANASYRV
jgi:L-ornithine N5-oxygenase